MKIIQHGSPKHNKPDRRFECNYCGCVFEAGYDEYKCPECGNKAYSE